MTILTALSTSLVAFAAGGWILFPLFWVLLIVGIVFLVRGRGAPWTGGGRKPGSTYSSAASPKAN